MGQKKGTTDTTTSSTTTTTTTTTEKKRGRGRPPKNPKPVQEEEEQPTTEEVLVTENGGGGSGTNENNDDEQVEQVTPDEEDKNDEEEDGSSESKSKSTNDSYNDFDEAKEIKDDDSNADDAMDCDGVDEEDEQWDLKQVLSIAEIREKPTKCQHDHCMLPACCVWISTTGDKWRTCLDCQEEDYGGWPPLDELPTKYLEPEHMATIAKKCSKQLGPTMPVFPSSPSSPSKENDATGGNGGKASFLTPPPATTSAAATKKASNKITPSPNENPNKKPSASSIKMHQKWIADAQSMGGKDARIVVSKPAAKKLIFDLLYEAFSPMNITQVYQGLKAIVPSPVLSGCLKDMACNHDDDKNPFDDSDDEEGGSKDKKVSSTMAEPYAGSLHFKAGRNSSSTLYYVDHTKINRIDHEERNTLANDIAIAKGNEANLLDSIKTKVDEAKKLLSEPTNEDAEMQLGNEESALATLEEKVVEARALKVNEKHRLKIKKKIRHMTSSWRKRKRMCMDFLISMEENTEGSLSVKKAFSADGDLALDSDEGVAKSTITLAKQKKASGAGTSMKKKRKLMSKVASSSKSTEGTGTDSLADPTFVAVLLNSQQTVRRLYEDDDVEKL